MADTLWRLVRDYWAELLVSLLIGLTIWVSTLYDLQKGSFQSLQMLYYSLFLLIGFIAMFNSARTRVFTKRLLADKQRGKNGRKR